MTLGEQFRFELQSKRVAYGAELPDVIDTGERLADAIDRFGDSLAGEIASGIYTEAGLRERRRALGAAVLQVAQQVEDRATQIERTTETSFERAWAALTTPAADVLDYLTLRELRDLFRTLDPLIAEQSALSAARMGGNDALLRAILSGPSVAMSTDASGPLWVMPLRPAVMAELQQAIRDRVGPQGADAWRARELMSMARAARQIVAAGDGPDPIRALA
jgi:hypothetical protein